jgi:hypothetical protein
MAFELENENKLLIFVVPKEPYQIDSLICLFERKKAFI